MKKLRNMALRGFAIACASASFMAAVPAMAAEKSNTQTTTRSGYINGLETAMNTNEGKGTADAKVKTGMFTENENVVFYNSFGQKVNGLVRVEDKEYFFNENGIQTTGFVTFEDETYYFDPKTGEKMTGDIEVDGKEYFLNENGQTQSGWIERDGKRYWLNADGSVATGAVETKDGRFYMNEDGVMQTDITVDGWIYGADGKGKEDLSGYDKIAQAALAQLGVAQDCTRLVSNALAAVGINFHGAPHKYLSLGPVTSNPVPGDIIVYQGHVAIYIGNGMAVHGGWNGGTTAIHTVECSTPFVAFVHPILP